MTDKFTGSGINEELVENFEEYKEMIKSLYCCICLEIVKIPVECENCESLYCDDCWELVKTSGKKCVINCTAPVKKANKFVYDMLGKLKIKCPSCNRGGIGYDVYVKHSEVCFLNKKYSTVEELSRVVKEKEMKIQELCDELEVLKLNLNVSKKSNHGGEDLINMQQLRNQLVTFNLPVNQKMELYNCAIEGRLDEFKNLILNKKYPILEEVSAHNYFWTPLHYSMHYGQIDIVGFIMDTLKQNGILELAMRLQSDDGRCPLMCLLRSNSLNLEKKRQILERVLSRYQFDLTPEVKKEIRNRDLEDIVKKYRP